MLVEKHNRFKGAPWFDENRVETVLIGGCGGIGSWLTYFMSRADFNLYVVDDDIVEAHNIGGQMFREKDIGKLKVKCMADICEDFSSSTINIFQGRIVEDGDCPSYALAMGAFDNMDARKALFHNWKQTHDNSSITPLLIDGRLEAEQLQIFCVTPENMDKYEEEELFEDFLVEDAPCTYRQTTHTAAMIASHMVGFMTNHITNLYGRENIREVPYYYEYYTPINLTENERNK